jgi:hypothetical protein
VVREAGMSECDLDFIASLIDRADIPKAEKAYLKAAIETHGDIPDITGDRQHEAYGAFCKELKRGFPKHGSPGFSKAVLEWSRSKDGIYATAFVTKMMEWERRRDVLAPRKRAS